MRAIRKPVNLANPSTTVQVGADHRRPGRLHREPLYCWHTPPSRRHPLGRPRVRDDLLPALTDGINKIPLQRLRGPSRSDDEQDARTTRRAARTICPGRRPRRRRRLIFVSAKKRGKVPLIFEYRATRVAALTRDWPRINYLRSISRWIPAKRTRSGSGIKSTTMKGEELPQGLPIRLAAADL